MLGRSAPAKKTSIKLEKIIAKKNYMRLKILTFILLFSGNTIMTGQESKSNEIKVNVIHALFNAAEISYERIVFKNSAIGFSSHYNYSSGEFYLTHQYVLSPYYRRYFGKKRATNFFLEAGIDYYKDEDNSPRKTAIGLGPRLSTGWKFIRTDLWFCEISLGFGYSLINQESLSFPEIGRFGIFVGKRF